MLCATLFLLRLQVPQQSAPPPPSYCPLPPFLLSAFAQLTVFFSLCASMTRLLVVVLVVAILLNDTGTAKQPTSSVPIPKSDHPHHISHQKAGAHAHSWFAAQSICPSFQHHACTEHAPSQDLSPKSIFKIKFYVQVMDLSGGPRRSFAPGLGRVVVSTLCVQDNLIAAGGFNGDLVIRNTSQQEPVCRFAVHSPCLLPVPDSTLVQSGAVTLDLQHLTMLPATMLWSASAVGSMMVC